MNRKCSNQYLLETYLRTPEQCYALLDTLRNDDMSLIWSNDVSRPLTEEELQARWLLLSNNVYAHQKKATGGEPRKNYGSQSFEWHYTPKFREIEPVRPNGYYGANIYDRHIEKILMLAEFIMFFPREDAKGNPIGIGYVMTAYRMRWYSIELARVFKEYGGTDLDKDYSYSSYTLQFMVKAEKLLKATDNDVDEAVQMYCNEKRARGKRLSKRQIRTVYRRMLEYKLLRYWSSVPHISIEHYIQDLDLDIFSDDTTSDLLEVLIDIEERETWAKLSNSLPM